MGHRLSKSNNNNTNSTNNNRNSNDISRLRNEENLNSNPSGPPLASQSRSSIIDIRTSVPPDSTTTITSSSSLPIENQNFHIESATITVPSHTTSSAAAAAAAARRFVIKIQLTKMEPGCNPGDSTAATVSTSVAIDTENGNSSSENCDNNLNVATPILNLTFTKNIQCDSNDEIVIVSNEEIKLNNLNALSDRRIGGCVVNTNFISNFTPMTTVGTDQDGNQILQSNNHNVSLRDGNPNTNSACDMDGNGSVEAVVNVPENHMKFQNNSTTGFISTMCACKSEDEKDHCCRRKNSTAYPSKWRCCKCMCLHANIKDASQSEDGPSSSASSTSSKGSTKGNWTSKLNCTRTENPPPENSTDLAMWMPPENSTFLQIAPSARHPFKDIVLLALNCSPSLLVGPTEDCDERARRLRALEIETGFDPMSDIGSTLANAISGQKRCDHFLCSLCSPTFRHVVHSQVDYIHCLVPDLDKITNSSFYWGKMDRYEAERLLEGKPEGTFLLRDSAQEEYLFSVTFRKYGRSLHARIEQFNHKFSFDCHDPGVFTARTVTGLLEHYKDPSCVMFFEPMLTIPLHRNTPFSLQQLCRATIASNVTYDGINELQLPNMLKAYVKEYHYKLRVRVKPFDELYQCS